MGYFGGTRVAVLALVAFVIGLSLPATSVDSQDLKLAIAEPDSQVSSQQIMVCVSWDTKEIKYSKYWRFCPSKHASVMLGLEGPKGERGAPGPGGPTGATGARGPSGNTTSLWDSLRTCNQRLQTAVKTGYQIHLKKDRDAFESTSGCIVESPESTLDASKQSIYSNLGFPYISHIELVSIGEAIEGDSIMGVDSEGRRATISMTISNADALSAFTSSSNSYRHCVLIGDDLTGKATLNMSSGGLATAVVSISSVDAQELKLSLKLGYQRFNFTSTCESYPVFSGEPDLVYYADPSVWPNNSMKAYWGW